MEWCYECGAFRVLKIKDGNLCVDSTWCRPVGNGGVNPWHRWVMANEVMMRRRNENLP